MVHLVVVLECIKNCVSISVKYPWFSDTSFTKPVETIVTYLHYHYFDVVMQQLMSLGIQLSRRDTNITILHMTVS